MDDIFRSFFGFNRRNFPGQWQDRESNDPPFDHEDQDDSQDPHDNRSPEQDGFGFQSPDGAFSFSFHFPEPDQMFRHFEEMFRDMGLSQFPKHPPGGFPALPGQEQPTSPRDEMLKKPDTQEPSPRQPPNFFMQPWSMPVRKPKPEQKQDTDLDKEVEKKGLDAILSKSAEKRVGPVIPSQQPSNSFSFRSVTIRTKQGPDGSLEEHRTVRDETGREETTVRRIRDGQEHSIITRTDPAGRRDKEENFVNMDEKELDKFEESWRKSGQYGSRDAWGHHMPEENIDPQTKSIFKNIFGFSFPGFGKT